MSASTRRRLDQVDAMRPVKQAGVLSTHSIVNFAAAGASLSSGAALLLLHVSREGFFFVSACMLTYTYSDLRWDGLRRFYSRRFVSVGLPYLAWILIYFFSQLPRAHYTGVSPALHRLTAMLETGYYQLYFLLVIMQFYLVFPLLMVVLRRTRGQHGLVVAAALLAQFGLAIAGHWRLLPAPMMKYQEQDVLSYLSYLVGGCVVACHLDQVDAWVRRHARLVLLATAAAALAAEGVYFLAHYGVTAVLGSGSDPFQPSVIPFNIGAIACGYLAGVALVKPGRSRLTRAALRVGTDNAYGVYLSHMLVINALVWLGWRNLGASVPWPLLCLAAVGIVLLCCVPLTALLARTPLAVPLAGRPRVPWHRPAWLRPRPAGRHALGSVRPRVPYSGTIRGSAAVTPPSLSGTSAYGSRA